MKQQQQQLSVIFQTGETIPMPVPASYNDVTQDKAVRDHVGLVWYDRTFYVPEAWRQSSLVWLRFGSVHYAAQVVSILTPGYFSWKTCSLSLGTCEWQTESVAFT